jgi:hypothetical protein
MFQHSSGTPGAISTKLGTHMVVCMCKNLMYVYIYIYIISPKYHFPRGDDVGGLHGIPPYVTNRYRGNTQIGIQAKARYVCCAGTYIHTYIHLY